VTERHLYLGIISGTSRDGADTALVSFKKQRPELVDALCLPYPDGLAGKLETLVQAARRPTAQEMAELDPLIAAHFGTACQQVLQRTATDPGDVAAIGSHGQTVWHDPSGPRPESIQLGDAGLIARQTGIVTVGDFRAADIAAGGQGAPLAPLLHRALLQPAEGCRVVLNLGGIANVSVLRADGGVEGYDTGPANCLLDAWIGRHRGEKLDVDGRWAAGGAVDRQLLEEMLTDPYFSLAAPKSTGTEYFNLAWLERFGRVQLLEPRDVQATLLELTAVSATHSILCHSPTDVLVCGGGVHNTQLTQRIEHGLGSLPLSSTQDAGLNPDWVEAMLFAWLARERIEGREQDTGSITGARKPVLLGRVSPAQ
jgi:anhydro-N-acetylmuramic acid kinase